MKDFKIITFDAVVVGTGAAGYNAACRIAEDGRKSVAIVTEGINCGTSRNTGSDKQTYYKLGLGGDNPDSVGQMARDLFSAGSVDGDTALCEAALSVRSFMNLCELGVGFPVNRYGEYIGYKTDHDPYARATSAGPLTSKFMTEALQKKAETLNIPVYNGLLAVEILKDEVGVCGLTCLQKESGKFIVFRCPNIILATGGPAGIYADSVYPECHTGSTGLSLAAGAAAQNMTEWQYGLASTHPRWNVSGTYMQVLPRFVSVDENGNESEFLLDYFSEPYQALSMVFLKGYQWPFDSKKVLSGSSIIDLLVYRECILKNHRVYLDYTKNPFGLEKVEYSLLSKEAFAYLKNANACFGKPIDRLAQMNQPAIDLYTGKGLDITKQYLEIALCAQHNNGGISVDLWWQTEVQGLFAAGECAGTHGVYRPGGSALNAGQVGSLRAAQFISQSNIRVIDIDNFDVIAKKSVNKQYNFCNRILHNESNVQDKMAHAQRRMSEVGAAIRSSDSMQIVLTEVETQLDSFESAIGVSDVKSLFQAYKFQDILICQAAVLTSLINYSKVIGETRGSALYYDKNGCLADGLEEIFRFCPDTGTASKKVQQVYYHQSGCLVKWRDVRPLVQNNDFFENIWCQYRINKNIY